MNHTPAPWVIGNPTEIHAADGTRIVMCCQTADDADLCQAEANARLIAAAPDLLAALERIAIGQEMTGCFTHAETVLRYQEIARAAIAKATGEVK